MTAEEKEFKKYSTLIYRLFNIVLSLSEEQQHALLKHAEKMFFEEKRIDPRKLCNIPVYYANFDHIYSNYIKNISRSGLFIETRRSLSVGEEISMTFRLKGFENPVKIRGKVARATRSGIGVEFKKTSPFLIRVIGMLVEQMKD